MESPSVLQKITDLVKDEIQKGVNEKLTKYAEYVSRRYDISLNILLDDMRNLDILEIPKVDHGDCDNGQCLGTKAGGKRCKLKGKYNGYCRWHKQQKPHRVPSRTFTGEIEPELKHTHTLPPLFKAGCPACERTKNTTQQQLLIDI